MFDAEGFKREQRIERIIDGVVREVVNQQPKNPLFAQEFLAIIEQYRTSRHLPNENSDAIALFNSFILPAITLAVGMDGQDQILDTISSSVQELPTNSPGYGYVF